PPPATAPATATATSTSSAASTTAASATAATSADVPERLDAGLDPGLPVLAADAERGSGHDCLLDERGPGHAHGDLGHVRDLRLRPARSRRCLLVHLHADGELSVPLLVPHVHDGHGPR